MGPPTLSRYTAHKSSIIPPETATATATETAAAKPNRLLNANSFISAAATSAA